MECGVLTPLFSVLWLSMECGDLTPLFSVLWLSMECGVLTPLFCVFLSFLATDGSVDNEVEKKAAS
jgi:hypothetical protein